MIDIYSRLAKLEERVNNIVRYGTILQVDTSTNRVIVDLGNDVESPELPYLVNGSGNATIYFVPKIGDQVVVISKNGDIEGGFVMPQIWKGATSGTSDEWRLEFNQGSIIYQGGNIEIKANVGVKVEALNVDIKSMKATIDANQIVLGGEDGGEVVCKMHTCSFTGSPHVMGSSKIKGAM